MPPSRRPHPHATLLGTLLLVACGSAPDGPVPPIAPPTAPPKTPDTTTATPPPLPPLAVAILDVVPRTDTVGRVGLDLVGGVTGARNWSAVVHVDSGTAGERRLQLLGAGVGYASDTVWGAAFAPGPGRHRFTLVVTDAARRVASASFERVIAIDAAPYGVTALPDLGRGAGVTAISQAGDVAGWVVGADGRRKPAIWRDGALSIVPAPDTVDVVATGVNAAGDVLLQYDASRAGPSAVRVRRSDGTERTLTGGAACCEVAVELTESRLALGTTPTTYVAPYAAVLDVATGVVTDVSAIGTLALNSKGQRAGAVPGGYQMVGRLLQTAGFTAPPPPVDYSVTICDAAHRFSRLVPLALDDDANLLADYCGNLVLLPQHGRSEFVDRYLGRTNDVRLSRRGGLLAGLDSSGALLLWRVGTGRTARVAVAGGWRIDAIAAVNANGAIAAHGVDASGRAAALRLTPVGP